MARNENQNWIKKIKRNVYSFIHGVILKLAGEGLVQQGLVQIVQRGEFALVDRFEASGFFAEIIQLTNHFDLFGEAWNHYGKCPKVSEANELLSGSLGFGLHLVHHKLGT